MDAYYQDEDLYEDDGSWMAGDDPVYYQDPADNEATWPDYDQDYYDEDESSPVMDDAFDVEKFDEVYASYTDAKARLNAMNVSRGFYSVVALVDKGAGLSATSSPKSSKGKRGKSGKGKHGKGKNKQMPRCSQAGHWARNCPQASGEGKKRKVDQEEKILMVESYHMDDGDGEDDEAVNHAIQDGGAASVLGSYHQIKKYLRHLVEIGFGISTIEFSRCEKGFKYGNSHRDYSHVCFSQ